MQETNTQTDKIITSVIEEEMKKSYLDYAMSVIVSRALPDVRDGLKPVHRRILFAMNDMGMHHNKPYKKSARIVGECLGKYHPHGDSSVYEAMVRMAQDFSLRYPLVKGQGNFGSVDGDSAAAMRYTEAKMNKLAEEILADIDKNTVKFVDNFDGSLKEPSVLPSRIPTLLINGASGIAVGMATNIPPHNLTEVCEGIIQYIDNPQITVKELMQTIKGPDFPTGGIIATEYGIEQAFTTGRGKIKVKSRYFIEEHKNRERIIVSEIPYQVNKAMLIQQIAELVRDKRVLGISDLRDESDREGMRIVIELKKDAQSDIVINQLMKYSRMKVTFGINTLALVNNEPKTLGLTNVIGFFVKHRQEVIRKKTEFELDKAQKRSHILEGLIIALNHIDEIVQKIKDSSNTSIAIQMLIADYSLSEEQAKAILDMKLQKLSGMEQKKLRIEHKDLMTLILELQEILDSEEKILNIIKEEIIGIKEKYGDKRKTDIIFEPDEGVDIENLIEEEDVVVTISHQGYIKRLAIDTYRQQRRGGKGIIGATTKDEDFTEYIFIANTHSYVLFFTDDGQMHWLKVYNIPETSRQSKGKAIINLIEIKGEQKLTAFVPVKEFTDNHFLFMATDKGVIKKTPLGLFAKPRKGGIRAISLDEDEKLINVMTTNGDNQVILASRNGLAAKFHENTVRAMGRSAHGVIGMRLKPGDKVVGAAIAKDEKTLLTVTENGFGKRTPISDYRLINRGGRGVINIQCSDRNGKVTAIKSVEEIDDLLLISKNGIVIRTNVHNISVIGRNTQGVRLMRIKDGDTVVAAAKIIAEEEETTLIENEITDNNE